MTLIIRKKSRQKRPVDPAEGPAFFVNPAWEQQTELFPFVLSGVFHLLFVRGVLVVISLFPPPLLQPKMEFSATAVMIRLPQAPLRYIPNKVELKDALVAKAELRKRADRLLNELLERQRRTPALEPPPQMSGAGGQQSQREVQAILIQPQYPLDLPPPPTAKAVPTALVMARRAAPLPSDRLVNPGPAKRLSDPVALGAPRIEVPAAMRLNSAVLESIRQAGVPDDPRKAADAGREAFPVALLAVSDIPVTGNTIVVPPGNLLPAAPNAGSGRGMRPGSGAAPPAETSRTPPARNASPAPQGPAKAVAKAEPAEPPKAPKPAAAMTVAAAPAKPLAATPPAAAEAQPAMAAPAPVLTARSEPVKPATTEEQGRRYPANGRFDIVIMQSTPDDSLPAGALGGKPVYTVYLPVGDKSDWIMHYCASQAGIVQNGGVVQLPDPRPLTAPYPQLTFRPSETISGPRSYILVYGSIDESGSVSNLKLLGPAESFGNSLLAALSKWRFRPAMRGESPEKVEMVLAIPVQKT